MEWISVNERTPKQKQNVLVIGDYINELEPVKKKQIGLVEWGNKNNSDLLNQCYYPERFTNITHWCEIPKQPEQTK